MLLTRENLEVKCFQYADDTTIYDHAKVYDLKKYKNTIAQSINKLSDLKRIYPCLKQRQNQGYDPFHLANVRSTSPDNYDPNISVSGYKLEYNLLYIANC